MSSRSYVEPKFQVGDLVEYIPGWREAETEFVFKRWIGFVKVVEITIIQTKTPAIYQVQWSDSGDKDKGWYTEGQLKLLSKVMEDER